MIDTDLYFTVMVFLLFLCYGFTNWYIVVSLRKRGNYTVGLMELVTIFMGNIKNYINLNRKFRELAVVEDKHVFFNKCVGVMHILSPALIVLSILMWIVSVGLY